MCLLQHPPHPQLQPHHYALPLLWLLQHQVANISAGAGVPVHYRASLTLDPAKRLHPIVRFNWRPAFSMLVTQTVSTASSMRAGVQTSAATVPITAQGIIALLPAANLSTPHLDHLQPLQRLQPQSTHVLHPVHHQRQAKPPQHLVSRCHHHLVFASKPAILTRDTRLSHPLGPYQYLVLPATIFTQITARVIGSSSTHQQTHPRAPPTRSQTSPKAARILVTTNTRRAWVLMLRVARVPY
jgi:hypothetical protein